MKAQPIRGKRVGTFEGRTGDQFQMANGMVEIFVEDAGRNEENGESMVTIRHRKDHPVDEVRTEVTIPEFAWERMKEEVDSLF